MAYTDVFGGSTVQPSDVQFSAVTLSASITTAWPPYAVGDTQVLARIMKVNATTGALTISLPDATKSGTGQDVLFDNSGANTFTVLDYDGNVIATLAAGQVKYFYLSDSTTTAGTWRVTLFGASASALDAASLAGYGLKAINTTINTAAVTTTIFGPTTVGITDRSKVFIWTGVSGALTLPTTSGSTSDFAIEVRNQGTGTLTLSPVGGVLIDGSATVTLSVGESCFVHMGPVDWYTVGRGRNTAFNFTQLSKVVTGGTTTLTLTEASNVVQEYTGALLSNATIVLPAVVQVYYINNATTGTYTLTFQSAAGGSSVEINQGNAGILYCNGTDIINSNTSLSGGITTLVFAPGTVSAPSVAFNEVATGFYQYASHEIGVSSNGVNVGKFSSNGWVGDATGALNGTLGATTPASASVTTITASGVSVLNGTTIPASSTLLTTATGAPINDPTFTGTVVLPATTSIGTISSTEIGYLDGVTSGIQAQINAKSPIASPTFTGTVTIPSGASIDGFAPIASPTFTGTVTIPSGASIAGFAPLASPALTGAPTAPTATPGTNNTEIANTAFTTNAITTQLGGVLPVTAWVSGASYVTGNNVYSLIDFLSYRRTTNGAGTTDPSADPVNWVSTGAANLTGDVTGTIDVTVVGINDTLLSGLATGLLKNTTTTGVPSIAVSGTDIKTVGGVSVLGSGDIPIGLTVSVVSGTSQAAVAGYHYILTNVSATTVTLPASPASGNTVWITVANAITTNVISRNGETIMDVAEDMTIDNQNATVELRFVSSSWRLV